MQTLYKIRKQSNNKYSSGGADPIWTKSGKLWSAACQVSKHLMMWLREGNDVTDTRDWVVEEYQLVKVGEKRIDEFL